MIVEGREREGERGKERGRERKGEGGREREEGGRGEGEGRRGRGREECRGGERARERRDLEARGGGLLERAISVSVLIKAACAESVFFLFFLLVLPRTQY